MASPSPAHSSLRTTRSPVAVPPSPRQNRTRDPPLSLFSAGFRPGRFLSSAAAGIGITSVPASLFMVVPLLVLAPVLLDSLRPPRHPQAPRPASLLQFALTNALQPAGRLDC